jgi:hypothetical protein
MTSGGREEEKWRYFASEKVFSYEFPVEKWNIP